MYGKKIIISKNSNLVYTQYNYSTLHHIVQSIDAITLGEATTWNIWKETLTFRVKALLTSRRKAFTRNVEVSFHIFQVVASPKVIASCYPRLPTLAPIAQDSVHRPTYRCSLLYTALSLTYSDFLSPNSSAYEAKIRYVLFELLE